MPAKIRRKQPAAVAYHHTDAPKCPYCGHPEDNEVPLAFENSAVNLTIQPCSSCGHEYQLERAIKLVYTSRPKETV